MQGQSLTLIAPSLAIVLFSMNAQASIDVYSQAPSTSNYAQSAVWNNPNDTGFNWTLDSDQERWDYFSIGGSADVSFDRIGWYGTNADGNFAVDLFSATCFSCGSTPVNGGGRFSHTAAPYNSLTLLPNAGPFNQAQVHKTLVSGGLYSYYIDLTSTITLDHTQTYALSVVNNYSSLPFDWALSNTSGSHLQYIIGQAMFLRASGNMAFTLTNTSASAVPIPASAWLLGSGVISLFGFAHKRKKA